MHYLRVPLRDPEFFFHVRELLPQFCPARARASCVGPSKQVITSTDLLNTNTSRERVPTFASVSTLGNTWLNLT